MATTHINQYALEATTTAFNAWMERFADPSTKDPLRRLCWLHFKHLRRANGSPLMTFRDVLIQTLAVTLYEDRGGLIDGSRNQMQYLLGRTSVSVWRRSRQVADGTVYDKEERKQLQRRPRLFHRAFNEVFLRAGVGKVLAYVRQGMIKHGNQ